MTPTHAVGCPALKGKDCLCSEKPREHRYIDVTMCSSCGEDHKNLLVHPATLTRSAFVECPKTAIHIFITMETQEEKVSQLTDEPDGGEDGMSPRGRARTRAVHYRSDQDVVSRLPAQDGMLDAENETSDALLVEAILPDAGASEVNSYQVGGTHYGLREFQHWDMVALFDLDYFQGQITKYVMRWRDKNGIEDLEKAKHYLEKYIAVEKENLRREGHDA